ncbi:MAG: domain containing protein [Chitinophagaceae bacterium]|nr:domain containing protein [Chitinophagaceae bacterium]
MKRFLLLFTVTLAVFQTAKSQTCTTLGQTPATAFPVCGTNVFTQTSVPPCVNHVIPTNCTNDGNIYQDLNPYWYKFTCFQSGTLGFQINPNNSGDDYDWQLFDITGYNPEEVFNSSSLIVSYNWSGEQGNTGSSSAGTSLFVCGSTFQNGIPGPIRPLFSKMPSIIAGHQYLLMISHFSGDEQSGYQLSFNGGTASITNLTDPELQSAATNCDASQIRIKLNKKMKCASLSTDGTDFTLSSGTVTITGATSANCSRGFDMDSVILTLNNPLPPGDYTVTAVNGSDGNTLKDNCDRSIPVGENLNFTILPLQPTAVDSLATVKCAPNSLQLVFRKQIRCNSISADGSDFFVTGTQPVSVIGASGSCSDGSSPVITIQLSSPIYTAGSFQLHLKAGIDGNTIIDECGQQTPAGQSISFATKDTVSAIFTYAVDMGCKQDTIHYLHPAGHGVNKWKWNFDNRSSGDLQNAEFIYPASGEYSTQLIVSNGFCSDSSTLNISLNNEVTADFEMPDIICPEDSATFINKSQGPIDGWLWNFGLSATSSSQNPGAQHYPVTGKETYYTVGLTVHSLMGCQERISKTIRVLGSCYIAVPSAFTPNNDGLNDYLYPLNALKADHLNFRVFNRWGQLVFATGDWQRKWDGTINSVPQASGVYVWILQFTNHDTGKKIETKGTTMLIR